MADFFCWTVNYGKQSACSWYRIMVPMMELRNQGFAQIYEDNGQGDQQKANFALLHSDIGHFYAISGADALHRMRSLKRVKPGYRKTTEGGVEIYPPALIWDHDDNTDFIHPFNMVFAHRGTRGYPDGRLLKPGEGLIITNVEGKVVTRWVDKESEYEGITFDIERNVNDMMIRHQIMREVHGCTFASPMLAKYAKEVVGAKNVYVFPNTISPSHYEKIRGVRMDPKVRILWQGGQSHYIDWWPLRDALREFCQKYRGKATIVWYGEYFDWLADIIPPDMLEFHFWNEYPAYRLKRGLLNIDINLCPLVNNTFNNAKSAIKWYEATIFEDMPEATLAQRGQVYNEIEDGVTGMLFNGPDDFVQKLGTLVDSPELRVRLGKAAHKWVLANRTPEKTIPGLFDFYAETRARQKRDLGKPVIQTATHEQIMKLGTPLR